MECGYYSNSLRSWKLTRPKNAFYGLVCDVSLGDGLSSLLDDMSDEEYARLMGLVRGAGGGDARFPKGAYERDNMVATRVEEASTNVSEAIKAAAPKTVRANALDGTGASVRFRIGTLSLPNTLLERIRLVLKGMSSLSTQHLLSFIAHPLFHTSFPLPPVSWQLTHFCIPF